MDRHRLSDPGAAEQTLSASSEMPGGQVPDQLLIDVQCVPEIETGSDPRLWQPAEPEPPGGCPYSPTRSPRRVFVRYR